MEIIAEIVRRLFAQAPATTVVLSVLLIALAALLLSSAKRLWRCRPATAARRSAGPSPSRWAVEWQNAGLTSDRWQWSVDDSGGAANQGNDQEFVVGYRMVKLLPAFLAGVIGLVVMSAFSLSTLPFLGADFVSGTVLLLIFAPCIPAIYCAWIVWRAGQRMWRLGKGLPAYRINDEFIGVGNRRYAWSDLDGVGRTMSSGPGGDELMTLMLCLANKNVLSLDLSGLDCRPQQLGMQIERFWRRQQRLPELFYALALSRVAGFVLPLRTLRAVPWRVSPGVDDSFRAMAKVGVIPPTIGAGVEFLVGGEPRGGMIALCTYCGDGPDDDDQRPLWQRVDLGHLAGILLARVAQLLATTYGRVDGPTIQTQPTLEVKALPQAVLATELSIAELSLDELDTAAAMVEDRVVFCLTLDAPLLTLLDREEKRHADARGDFPTYLEHEVVTTFRRFMASRDAAA